MHVQSARHWILATLLAISATTQSILAEPPPSAIGHPESTSLEELHREAMTLWCSDPDAALDLVAQMIARFPDSPDGYWLRSQFLSGRQETSQAIADSRRVTELAPDFTTAWGNLGWNLILAGDIPAAREVTEKALLREPTNYAWSINLGHTYLLEGDRETAHRWYRDTIPLVPDDGALRSGPLADFDLFVERGRHVAAAKEERDWVQASYEARPDVYTAYWEARRLDANADDATVQAAIARVLADIDELETYLSADNPATTAFYNNLAMMAKRVGRFDDAEALFRRAIALEEHLSADDPSRLASRINCLASVLYRMGRMDESETEFRAALALVEQTGESHQDLTLVVLNNLATLLVEVGRYLEADAILQRSETLAEAVYPENHAERVGMRRLLVHRYRTEGRELAERDAHLRAAVAYERAATVERTGSEPRDIELARLLAEAARLYYRADRYREAEELHREALGIREAVLPAGDTAIGSSLAGLAHVLRELGQYNEAEALYRQALALYEAESPAGRLGVAVVSSSLAGLLEASARYEEAESLYRKALEVRKSALSEGHPDIRKSLENLAELYQTTGRYTQAESLYREALASARANLAEDDLAIEASLNNLAGVLVLTGRYGEAEPLLREALAIARAVRAEDDIGIARGLNNLAFVFEATGRCDAAEALLRESLAIVRAARPAGDPTLAAPLDNLGDLLMTAGRSDEAEALLREALSIRQSALHAYHPDRAASLNNLAQWLEHAGRFWEAEVLYREALMIATVVGEPRALWTIEGNLADYYAARGERLLALYFGKEAVADLQTVRTDLLDAGPATWQAFVESHAGYYTVLADLLVDEGRSDEAQQVLDLMEGLDGEAVGSVNEAAAANALRGEDTPLEAAWLAASRQWERGELIAIAAEQWGLAAIDSAERTPEQEARLAELEAELDAAAAYFDELMDAIELALGSPDWAGRDR